MFSYELKYEINLNNIPKTIINAPYTNLTYPDQEQPNNNEYNEKYYYLQKNKFIYASDGLI
jgi:hypothetical protein